MAVKKNAADRLYYTLTGHVLCIHPGKRPADYYRFHSKAEWNRLIGKLALLYTKTGSLSIKKITAAAMSKKLASFSKAKVK